MKTLSQDDVKRVASQLLGTIGMKLLRHQEIQALWAGYGFVFAIEAKPLGHHCFDSDSRQLSLARGLPLDTQGNAHLIMKIISPPESRDDEGHLRKIFSYEVEQYFYEEISPHLSPDVAVATYLTSSRNSCPSSTSSLPTMLAILMTDLRGAFPVSSGKRGQIGPTQVHSAIRWLAKFHGSAWSLRDKYPIASLLLPPLDEARHRKGKNCVVPRTIWLNGGYTYLATRRAEYESLASLTDSEWSVAFCASDGTLSVADKVARFLTPKGKSFETVIHGDVKSENLFSTESGDRVAFFDFQYVGLGLGVSDLAKLFTCSVPIRMLTSRTPPAYGHLPMQQKELDLLREYHRLLVETCMGDHVTYEFSDLRMHWETSLVDFCRFQASWGWWGNTNWLQARVRSILANDAWIKWLDGHVYGDSSERCE